MTENTEMIEEAEAVARSLAADIGVQAFDDLIEPRWSNLIPGGSSWTCEDSDLTNRDPHSFPVVLVRDGQRFEVELEPRVVPLGLLVDEQQPTFYTGKGAIEARNYTTHRDALLTWTGSLCANCGGRLIEQWVRFPDASREREVHADCRHWVELRRDHPECFRDLGFEALVAHGDVAALPELLPTRAEVHAVAERFGFIPMTRVGGDPTRWRFRGGPLELYVEDDDTAVRVLLTSGARVLASLYEGSTDAPAVTRTQLVEALVAAFGQHVERAGRRGTGAGEGS